MPIYTEAQRAAAAKAFSAAPETLTDADMANWTRTVEEGIRALGKDAPADSISKADAEALIEKFRSDNDAKLEQYKLDHDRALADLKKPADVDPDSSKQSLSRLSQIKSMPQLQEALEKPAEDVDMKALQIVHDDLLLLRAGRRWSDYNRGGLPREWKLVDLPYFQEVEKRNPMIAAAYKSAYEGYKAAGLDTATSTDGSQWAPTLYSATLVDRIFQDLTITSLFDRITQARTAVVMPAALTGGTAYLMGEATDDTASAYTSSAPYTGSITMTAKKLACVFPWSEEWEEDSVVQPVLGYLRECQARVLGEGIEEGIINGDTTSAHFDSNLIAGGATTDRRHWCDGLRHQAVVTLTTASGDCSTFTGVNLLHFLTHFTQKYIQRRSDVVWILPTVLRPKTTFLVDDGTNKNPVFLKASQLGDNLVVNGQIADLFGMPVIETCWIPLTQGTGGIADSAGTATSIVFTNRRCWTIGDARTVTMDVENQPRYGLRYLIASWRGSFTNMMLSTDVHTGCAYNITP